MEVSFSLMKEVTRKLINNFEIMSKKVDFCGYKVDRYESLNFHHLIIPRRECYKKNVPNEGYVYWNGAILVRDTSHDYIHLIEKRDYKIFSYITSEMIDINVKGFLDIENLKNIGELLSEFEYKYGNVVNKEGKKLIKSKYYDRLYK